MGFYYSPQLRGKALESIANGNTQAEVSRIFGINRTTIYRWPLLKEKTNNLNPRINHNIKKKKIDIEKLKKYISTNYSETLKEIARNFNVSYVDIWYHLKKLGYVIKKNSKDISKGMKIKEKNI